jgi:hypothetical protein
MMKNVRRAGVAIAAVAVLSVGVLGSTAAQAADTSWATIDSRMTMADTSW